MRPSWATRPCPRRWSDWSSKPLRESNDASSERRIHFAASDMGGSANARGGVLSFARTPPKFLIMSKHDDKLFRLSTAIVAASVLLIVVGIAATLIQGSWLSLRQ